MKKYVLILSVSALLLITNNAYSLYDLTLATQTVTDCANSAQDGSTGGAGLFTISPTACQRIKLTIDQKAAQLLIIREGIDGLGSIIYNGTAVTLVDSILYTNYGITSVTIEFDHANASAGNEYLITWQGQFASDGASTNNECFGDINGTAQLFPTGGTAGYTYSWTPAGATRKIENLPIGTYTVTATDANGCKFDTSYTITQNPEISSTIDQTKISCFGLNDGEATVNPTGGTGAFTYIWDNGKGTAATATGLAPATTYNITITDANHTSCFITKNITVTENPEFTATISETKKSCFGASDATALVTVSPTNDGSGVISSYLWSNGSTIATASGLAESTAYTCTVTDSEDCTAIIPAFSTTAQNSKINASIAETQKDCFGGGNDGEAQISASGGTPTLGYLWSSGSATTTESGLAAATFYDCTVTDNIGCNATFTITTSAINPEITATINETKKDCFDGADDGTAEISALGGVAPLTYLWSTGSITTGATGLAPGIFYDCTVTDANGCTFTTDITTTAQNPEFNASIAETKKACFGISDATAEVTISVTEPGSGTISSYLWSNGSTIATAAGLSPLTVYTCTVTDDEGCTATIPAFSTTAQNSKINASIAETQKDCFGGGNDGEAQISASGGTPTLGYLWSSGSATTTESGLAAATFYDCTVTDNIGCNATFTITTSAINPEITATITETKKDCFDGADDGTAEISALGGVAPLTYLWSTGSITTGATGLAPGIFYDCTVTDANGCTFTTDITTTAQNPEFNASIAETKEACFGISDATAEVTISVTEPGSGTISSYLWSNGSTIATAAGLSPLTVYTCTVTDDEGCTATIPAFSTTAQNPEITATIAQTKISCFGLNDGQATVTPSGGTGSYTYNWSEGKGAAASATGLSPSVTYTVTVTDFTQTSCSITKNISVTQNPEITASVSQTKISCFNANNGEALITPAGGSASFNYLWDNTDATAAADNLTPAIHNVTVTDATHTSCSITKNITIAENPEITATIAQTKISCFGLDNGEATVNPTGGTGAFTYSWDNGNTTATATALTPILHGVTITDANHTSCSITKNITVTENPEFTATISETKKSCFGVSDATALVTVSATNNGSGVISSYLWSNGSTIASASGLAESTAYTCTVTDDEGCTATIPAFSTTAQNPEITATIAQSKISCFGLNDGQAAVTPDGGTGSYTYNWSEGKGAAATATGLSPSVNYTVTVTDATQTSCSITKNIAITQNPDITATIAQTKISCFSANDGQALVTPTGGSGSFNYLWDNTDATAAADNLTPAIHNVTVTDATNTSCSITKSITVAENPEITATLTETKKACFGLTNGEALTTPTGGSGSYTYLWDNGKGTAATATGLDPTVLYNVTITDANHTSCSITKNITVTENPVFEATISETKKACFGTNDATALVTVSATNNGSGVISSYLWSNGSTITTAAGLSASTAYTCIVTDDEDCTATIPAFSTTAQNPEITATIAQSKISCFGLNDGQATVTPAGGTGSYTYNWSEGKGAAASATGLSPSVNYTVTVTDATQTSCSITKNIAVTQNPDITATIAQTKISCFSANDGQALVTPTGGSGSFNYLWDNTDATAAADNLTPAIHNVTVTDATNTSCSITKSITVAENPEITATLTETKKACFGLTNGEALTTPTGGSGSYTYLWDNGKGTAATATGLDPTVLYNVTITDANHTSCTITKNITVTENTDITLLKTNSNYNSFGVSCFGASDGWIKVVPSNGTSPYSYQWNANAGSQITQKAEGLPIGSSFAVTVTDAIGCTKVSPNYSLDQPVALSITETITHVTYNGGNNGQIQISVPDTSGTSNLYWTGFNTVNGLGTQTGLTAGSYQVTVVDRNNCSANESYTVNQPAAPLQGGEISYGGVKTDYACYQTTSFAFSNVLGYSDGNIDSAYVYSWQYSTNGSTWTTIPATNADIYTRSTVLTQDLYYRRAVTNAGVTAYSDTIFLDYIANPGLAYSGLNTEYCKNASNVTLIGTPTTSYGTFVGTGIISTADGIATFSPTATDTSTFPNPISVIYRYNEHGCITELTKTTTIQPVPVPDFFLPNKISKSVGSHTIDGQSPTGGTFTGTNTTPEGVFYVSSLTPGPYDITYSVTNIYGCSHSTLKTTEVVEGIGSITVNGSGTNNDKFCIDGATQLIYATPAFNDDYYGYFLAPVTDMGDKQHGTLDPTTLTAGTHILQYTYSGTLGTFTIEQEITVYDVTNEAKIMGIESPYCNYNQIEAINANPLLNGDVGVFSGTGITDGTDGTATFNVATALGSSPVTIKYVYTQNISGCKDSVTQSVTVNPQPPVSFDTKTLFNRLGEVYKFQNIIPYGGIFEGEGISRSDSTFNPAAAKMGNNPVTYIFTDVKGCKDTAHYTLLVENAKGTIDGLPANKIYCKDGSNDKLFYTPADADSYIPVKMEIDGTTMSSNDTVTILPSTLSGGTHTVKSTYLGSDGITEFWISENFQIDDIGTLGINVPKTDYCNYNGSVTLKGKLNGVDVAWGTFSGSGVNTDLTNDGNATFLPTAAYEGVNSIYYTYTSKTTLSTCYKTDSTVITVHPRPTVDFTLKPLYSDKGAEEPIVVTPTGGYFEPTSLFINNTIFRPLVAGAADHTLTYNFTDGYSCFNSLSKVAKVVSAKGTIEGLNDYNIYCSDGINDTIYYKAPDADAHTPVSFTLDGNIIKTNSDTAIITPTLLTSGDHALKYTYKGSDGVTSFTLEQTITIDKIGNLDVLFDNEFCEYETASTLTGRIDLSIAARGVFTGTGIDPVDTDNDGIASFDPTKATVGTNTITYSYPSTRTNSTCTKSYNFNITVHPRPTLDFALKTLYSNKGADEPLAGIPSKGKFTPSGLFINDTIFRPSVAGAGDHTLTYKYTDGYSCSDSLSKVAKVVSAKGSIIGLNDYNIYCSDGINDTIHYVAPDGDAHTPINFTLDGNILSTASDFATIKPSELTPGPHILKYTYKGSDDSTPFTLEQTITIDKIGNIDINLPNDKYCEYEGAVILIGKLDGANVNRGYFKGKGIVDSETNGGDGSATFDPTQADLNNNTITYTYPSTNGASSCKKSIDTVITVNPKPELFFSVPNIINRLGGDYTLEATPAGGTFGPESYVEGVIFKPSLVPELGYLTLTYTNKDVNNCRDTVEYTTEIQDPTGTFFGVQTQYCYDAGNVTINVANINNIKPGTGYFHGAGIISTNGLQATFNPQVAWDDVSGDTTVKTITLYYTYKGTNDSTEFTISTTTKVRNNGKVKFPNLSANKSYCRNVLTPLTATPPGGDFFGICMVVNVFHPEKAHADSLTTQVTYTYSQGGCSIDSMVTLNLLDIPVLSLDFQSSICANAPADTIVGFPRGGKITGSNLSLDYFEGLEDSVRFSPKPSDVGEITKITYTYMDTTTLCSNTKTDTITVNEIPAISIQLAIPEKGFCNVNVDYPIIGLYNGAPAPTGIFDGAGVVTSPPNSGKGIFNPNSAGVNNANPILFTFIDNNSCENTVDTVTIINPLPDISLSYIADAYCSDYGELNISGSAPLGTYIMKINEISQAGKDKTITISDYANFDSIMIVFQATSSATNCTNTVTDTIQINHIPDVAFTYSDICIADSIKFNYTGDTPDNMIKSYSWNFGVDENSISAEKDPSYKYVTPKNVHVVLKVTDNLECFASADSLLELELNPQASFDWENECFNESKKIQFTNNNSYSPFYNYYWDFDDNSTSSEHKPEHAFPGTGAYHVKYVISSNNSKCTDTLTKTIHIRPTYVVSELNDNSYSQSFEDKPDGWIHETLVEGDDVDSWEWGDPVGKFSLSTANGQKVYGTGLTGLYKANENSAVTSPCFDLSGLERPMISLSTFSWMENGTDGAVLESSINDGKEWEIVGSVNSGINWYNDYVIKQTPGDNQGQGWTGNTQNWVVARHDLDALVGQKNVRFRIAFASDEIKEYEGFAFDNIKIGNRTRRVLIEHFSNYKKENSYSTDSVINKIREKNPADAIDILYESSISDSNQLYLKYPVGVKARETYYNVTQVPYSYFDGTTSFNFSGANTPTSTNLMSKALVDPLFQLNVSTQVEGASIKIKLDMKALADIESRQLQLFTAIVEEEVELVHANKTLTFHNVLRRFVPSPAGEYIETSWLKNDSVTYNFTYQINNYVVDAEKLVVVAFVQDENNLEVLQSATSDTTTNTPVSIEDYFAKSQKLDMMLFPNPTQGEVYLVLSQVPDNSSVVEVINQQGKVVQRAKPTAEQQLKLETQSLVQGIYFVRWVNNGNQVIKKLVVFH